MTVNPLSFPKTPLSLTLSPLRREREFTLQCSASCGLISKAAEGAFDLFVTADKNVRYQQDVRGGRLAILVLPVPDWKIVGIHADKVLAAVNSMHPGKYRELTW